MSTTHTKDQRRRLFLLARLLDRVPAKRFHMKGWFNAPGCWTAYEASSHFMANECGTTACAIGWGMTDKSIRGAARGPEYLVHDLMGEGSSWSNLFGSHRRVGPRRVASDIRRYLKTGVLPK